MNLPTDTDADTDTESGSDTERYVRAEERYLASEGVVATTHQVPLARLGGHVRVMIAGDGPPVVFVAGVMTPGTSFAGLVGRLPGFRCIMLDRPGTGLSPLVDPPPTDLAAHQRSADLLLVDMLDGLGIDRSHVVCTSMGGWTAFRSIAAHRDRFLRLSALSFQIGARMEKLPLSMRMPAIPWLTPNRVKATPRLVRAMLKSAGMRKVVEAGGFSDEMIDWMVAGLRYTDTFGNESLYNPRPASLRGPTTAILHSPELLAKVDLPVHLYWGTDDLFGGEAVAREFAAMLPDCEVEMIPDGSHAPWLEDPERAARSVERHLRGGA